MLGPALGSFLYSMLGTYKLSWFFIDLILKSADSLLDTTSSLNFANFEQVFEESVRNLKKKKSRKITFKYLPK